MNIGTHFDYNHIAYTSKNTKLGIPHEKALIAMQTEVNLLTQLSNVALGASFYL